MRRLFAKAETLEDLKKLYRDLAMKHHPDKGGNVELMKEINALYDEFFEKLKDVHKNKDGETYTKTTEETAADFQEMIEKLMKMDGIHIEVIGSFIWISGNTKQHKDELKQLKFRWHRKKLMWYKSPDGYRRHGNKEYDMDEIRNMYGVQYEADGNDNKPKKKRLTA